MECADNRYPRTLSRIALDNSVYHTQFQGLKRAWKPQYRKVHRRRRVALRTANLSYTNCPTRGRVSLEPRRREQAALGALFVRKGTQHRLFEAGADKGKGAVSIGNWHYQLSPPIKVGEQIR